MTDETPEGPGDEKPAGEDPQEPAESAEPESLADTEADLDHFFGSDDSWRFSPEGE